MAEVDEDEGGVTPTKRPSAEASVASATAGTAASPRASSPSPTMTRISRHYFSDNDSDRPADAFSIDIIENIQEEYGMFVWPCSIVLAEYVWQQRSRFFNVPVVELGAGTSLPGLVAEKVGADVILTDNSSNLEIGSNFLSVYMCLAVTKNLCPNDLSYTYVLRSDNFLCSDTEDKVLDNMRRTCGINRLNCKILGLTWGEWDVSLFSLKPKVVLGADVLYDGSDFDDLFATVTFLFQNTPGCVFITTYHNRSGHHLIEYLMVKWGWKCTRLLDAFSFMPSSKTAANLHGNIQLVEMMMK